MSKRAYNNTSVVESELMAAEAQENAIQVARRIVDSGIPVEDIDYLRIVESEILRASRRRDTTPQPKMQVVPGGSSWKCKGCTTSLEPGVAVLKVGKSRFCGECAKEGRTP